MARGKRARFKTATPKQRTAIMEERAVDAPVISGEVVINKSQLDIIEKHLVYIDALAKLIHGIAKDYGNSAIARKIDFMARQLKGSNDVAIKAVNGR
jgi:hypothetical protein